MEDEFIVDKNLIVQQVNKIMELAGKGSGSLAIATDFIKKYTGIKSSFYVQLNRLDPISTNSSTLEIRIKSILETFIRYVEFDLLEGLTIERKAQLDVVSDFLQQAQELLENNKVHPAAPAILIGAALEEYLRNWIDEEGISLDSKRPSIDAYMTSLKENDLISKQDTKDIVSWAGLRNSATHGNWEDVSERSRIFIMLEGVNLFMRKYSNL